MKIINKNKKSVIMISIIIAIVLISVSFAYINKVNIIKPTSISLIDSDIPIDSIDIIGISPLSRSFILNRDYNNQWHTLDYYLNSIYISVHNASTLGDSLALCYGFDNENRKDTIYLDANNSYKKIPLLIHPSFWEKLLFLASKIVKIIIINFSIIPFIVLVFFCFYFIKQKIPKPELLYYTTLNITTLGILLFISFYSVPNPEDYQISLYAKEYGFKLPVIFYYFTDGRYFTNFLYFIINPLYWGDEKLYFLSSIITILSVVSSCIYLIKKVFQVSYSDTVLIAGTTILIFTNALFSYSYIFFWMASAYVYAFIIVFINMLIGLTYSYFDTKSKNKYFTIKVSLLLFLFIGLNEISIIISFLYGVILLLLLIKFKKLSISHILIFSTIFISAFTVFYATGNDLRSFTKNYLSLSDRFEINYIIHVSNTTFFAVLDILKKIIFNTPLVINLTIFTFFLNQSSLIPFRVSSKIRIRIILIFLVLSYGISFIYIFPIDNGINIPERISNIILYLFVLAFLFSGLNLKSRKINSFLLKIDRSSKATKYLLIFTSLIMFNSNTGLFRVFFDELVSNKMKNYYQSNINIISTYKNNTNSFTYIKVNQSYNKSSLLFCQDIFSNSLFCNDIKNYFKNYNLSFTHNETLSKNFSSLTIFGQMNNAPIFLTPIGFVINKTEKNQILTLFKFGKIIGNNNSSCKSNFSKYINSQNIIDEVIKLDSAIIDVIPDSIYKNKFLQSQSFLLKIYSCFWDYFPKHITNISFNNQWVVLNYNDINTGINIPLKILYENDLYINRIFLTDFYEDLICSKQVFYRNRYPDSLQIMEFSTTYNPYIKTLQTYISLIKAPNSNFQKLQIDYFLTDINKSIIIPMKIIIEINNSKTKFQEITINKDKVLNFKNKKEKQLIYYLSTVKLYSKINKITFL